MIVSKIFFILWAIGTTYIFYMGAIRPDKLPRGLSYKDFFTTFPAVIFPLTIACWILMMVAAQYKWAI